MPGNPIAFTDDQRQLFHRVATAIRSDAQAFTPAGQWLDEKLVEGKIDGSFLALMRSVVEGFGDGVEYRQGLLNDPPVFDALPPAQAEQQARRVLLLAWLLTDPSDLTTEPRITRLQDWKWGEGYFSDDPLPSFDSSQSFANISITINRLYARMTLLDSHLDAWKKLARQALGVVSPLSDAGATGQANDAQPTDTSGWLTVSNAAQQSKVNRGEISRACDSGAIHSVAKGRARRLDPASFKVWKQRRQRGGEVKAAMGATTAKPPKAQVSSGLCRQCGDTVTLRDEAGTCPKCGSTAFEQLSRNAAQQAGRKH